MITIQGFFSINGADVSETYLFWSDELICSTKAVLISLGRSISRVLNNLAISRVLNDLHIQELAQKLNSSLTGKSYKCFRQDLSFENYLINLDIKHYLPLIKSRTNNHRLPVETGGWENIPLNERKCQLCAKNNLGDEYHSIYLYLFYCQRWNQCISDENKSGINH